MWGGCIEEVRGQRKFLRTRTTKIDALTKTVNFESAQHNEPSCGLRGCLYMGN